MSRLAASARLRIGVLGPVAAAALCTTPYAAGAGAVPFSARLECESAPRPGRVICTATGTSGEPWKLRWADALVVMAPEFAAPLRARVLASERDDHSAVVRIAFVASRSGEGEVAVRVRAVACADPERRRCSAVEREATAVLRVLGEGDR